MKEIEEIKILLENKKQKVDNLDDSEKIEVIEELLKDDAVFFKLKYSTAIGILKYLNIPDERINDFYNRLISPEKFQSCFPKQRVSININSNNENLKK